jgi:3-hydroxymyristoyl/3-hydroxydecanoyl-(acyl carrier protein) dehydratase
MIIQHYEFEMSDRAGPVYRGDTTFGFFTKQALAQQVGIREAQLLQATGLQPRGFPEAAPFPDKMLRMIDRIDHIDPQGGPRGHGFIQGSKAVDPGEWFFQAHFYQDPVWPGSLGLEAFVHLLKYMLVRRFGGDRFTMSPPIDSASAKPPSGVEDAAESANSPKPHRWIYRGQVLPTNRQVVVQAYITGWDERNRALCADGLLSVDGKVIYQMQDFTIRLEQA